MSKLKELVGLDDKSKLSGIKSEANKAITIRRLNGTDYIVYDGIKLSTEEDANNPSELLDRLERYKQSYIEHKAKELNIDYHDQREETNN